MIKTYMLDTNICSFIMREQPEAVIKRLEQAVLRNHRIVVSYLYQGKRKEHRLHAMPSPTCTVRIIPASMWYSRWQW